MLKGILLIALLGGFFSANAQIVVGDTIPPYTFTLSNGNSFKLDSVLNRTTIILFWATWNPASIELLQELKDQYSFINPIKKGARVMNIDVIDISIDTDQLLHAINLKREHLPWSVHLADYKGWESTDINYFKITKIPTLIILNENRKVIIMDIEPKQLRSVLSNLKLDSGLSN